MERIGIEHLSVFGLPRIEFVDLAADLGVHNISTSLQSTGTSPLGYPHFSLSTDPKLRREMGAALRNRGVTISLGEGFIVRPGVEARDRAPEIEALHELGGRRINVVSLDPDLGRTFDQFAIMAEMAAQAGIETTTEFAPALTVADLPTALAAVRHVGRPDFRLLIDTMHLIRSGAIPSDLAALDPNLIGYVQICDVPRYPAIPDYMEESMTERLAPGAGELPLSEILSAIPPSTVVGLEIPQLTEARSGIGHADRIRPAIDATRALLDQLG
ncbi:sugar phosphate isomerase/epimerase family protein [Nocardia vinacea]|uniref:sugar phosphate isomerase/epimerase family protein n=1 Tax=Nocardia vinacea TaxID=96468 RepID=UPI0002EB2D2F|nr:TIM barrel protein [Nocardia vinacea]